MRRSQGQVRRGVAVGLLVAFVAGGVVAYPREAKADPHAIFYTAIGQQQLFFNVLAALDQADYVEPVTGQFSSDELLQRRAAVPAEPSFGEETEPLIGETGTELSAVLTRPVTLDNNDARTDELVRFLAAEWRRLNAQQRVGRILCQYAYNLQDCEEDPDKAVLVGGAGSGGGGGVQAVLPSVIGQSAQAQVGILPWVGVGPLAAVAKKFLQQGAAFVNDPVTYLGDYYLNGVLAALSVGTPDDAEIRKARLDADPEKHPEQKIPYGASPYVWFARQLQKTVAGDIGGKPTGHILGELLDSDLIAAAREYWVGGNRQAHPYGIIVPVSQGSSQVELRPQLVRVNGYYELDRRNISDVGALASLYHRVGLAGYQAAQAAGQGGRGYSDIQELTTSDGWKAAVKDVFSIATGIPLEDGTTIRGTQGFVAGDRLGSWIAPYARPVGERTQAADQSGQAVLYSNQLQFPAGARQERGEQRFVQPDDQSSSSQPPQQLPASATAGSGSGGQVAGTHDPLTPVGSFVFPFEEDGLSNALMQASGLSYTGEEDGQSGSNGQCGFSC